MTEDDETRSLVGRAGDELPVSPAPVQDLLRQGRQARRRRTLTTVGVVVAAVAVITSGAVAVGSQLTDNPTVNPPISMPTITTPSTPSPGLSTPPGTRLIGRNGIGIAVPTTWDTNQDGCRGRLVIAERLAVPQGSCNTAQPIGSAVIFSTYGVRAKYLLVNRVRTSARVDGILVSRVAPSWDCAGYCVPSVFTGALLSESRDVVIFVRSKSRGVVAHILDSAFAIPAGYVAIPTNADQQTLERSGLQVEHATRISPIAPPGTVLGSEPPVGSVVARGSVVTVLTSTRQHESAGCAGLHVDVVTPTGHLPLRQGRRTYQISISVGDAVSLRTSGKCGESVRFGYPESDILENRDGAAFTAFRPGTAKVAVTIAMCAGRTDPKCRGGIATLGTLLIHVRE